MQTPPGKGPAGDAHRPAWGRGGGHVPTASSRTAIDIQSTAELSRSSPQSGFWTHVSQISPAAFKQHGLEQAQEQSGAEHGHPAHPCGPRRSSSIQMLMRLSGLSASVNGGGLGRQTAIVAAPGRDSGNSWFFSQRHLLETF